MVESCWIMVQSEVNQLRLHPTWTEAATLDIEGSSYATCANRDWNMLILPEVRYTGMMLRIRDITKWPQVSIFLCYIQNSARVGVNKNQIYGWRLKCPISRGPGQLVLLKPQIPRKLHRIWASEPSSCIGSHRMLSLGTISTTLHITCVLQGMINQLPFGKLTNCQ